MRILGINQFTNRYRNNVSKNDTNISNNSVNKNYADSVVFGQSFRLKSYPKLMPYADLIKNTDGRYPNHVASCCNSLQRIIDLSNSPPAKRNKFITKILTALRENEQYKEVGQNKYKKYTGLTKSADTILKAISDIKGKGASDQTTLRILDLFPI